ncbi:O-acetylhomoserine aminocarboxypropyltransferase/cysteine synthase [Halorussus gelatinilyticus]|uniref:O-acetylhomoserine aminocarboxypropyltransferase/cysteine synthase n=1 Tax=Halorussus gelatinilyticus TaxID=2937524 RepID=A0A8U0IMV4_9EURY|nr:O-acetylhomoserine aminocarboxypropyltransferase/cysteine synthase family protein [Halorussus gelatinilyticus]UPW02078.1 O-acetylhomoserine aminocarboxypropyltransferase/cysteine synthase [Halorussus gelatinilyticus]
MTDSEEAADQPRFDTRSLHAGHGADPATGARAPPIYQTTSYEFEDADHAADLYALDGDEDIYSRISNPTARFLEDRLASLEGGAGAVATSSGMAAFDSLVLVLAESGDNVVCSTDTYGGTTAHLRHTASKRGVEPRFVDTLDYAAYEEAVDDSTAFVHVETVGNPSLVTPDFERVAAIAHDAGAPLVVDNTFATPYLCNPLDHGADAVWESTTKWLHGSGTTVGGVLVDGGSFDWEARADRFPELAGDNAAYHDTDFSRDFPDAPLAAAARWRALRSLGNQQSPFDAWQTLQGLETLPLRMERHCENAAILAEYLADRDDVAWVAYPGLESHETHENAAKYLDGGYGGMIAFGLKDGFEAGKAFCENVELASFLANIGDAKTLVIHPASTTHAQLSPEEQEAAGVSPDLVRLSVGIEDPADLLADVERAIEASTGNRAGAGPT